MQTLIALLQRIAIFLMCITALVGCNSTPSISKPVPKLSLSLATGLYGHSMVNDGERLFVIGGTSEQGPSGDIEVINPDTNETELLKDKIVPRRYFSAVWDGKESIYIIGGISWHKGRSYLQTVVEVFNTRTHEVMQTAEHYRATRMNTAALVDNKIYVFGGEAAGKKLRKGLVYVPWVSVFDLTSQTWSELPDMPSAYATRATEFNGDIYVAGGFNGRKQFKDFYTFNPLTAAWSELAPLPVGTSAHSMVATKNRLYTFGNYSELDQVLHFDFDSGKWVSAEFSFSPSRHNASTVMSGKIFVAGGTIASRGSHLNYLQVFTPES